MSRCMFLCYYSVFVVSQILSYLLHLYFIFITRNSSCSPITIGILPRKKMYLSHYAKCMVTTTSDIILHFALLYDFSYLVGKQRKNDGLFP